MIFRRFFDPKLAQTSYLVGCPETREALIVDPSRSIEQYLRAATEDHLRVAHVTETHIHADFVSGARELAHQAGARLYLSGAGGRDWQYEYASDARATLLHDNSQFQVGHIRLHVLHLPGHTPEHLCFLVTDDGATVSEPMGALTGDFLFVGDVGRPDLLERAANLRGTMETGARQLFRSLQRFRELPDYLQIWPGHGAGSACGKALSAVPQSTLGYEKRFNWAFGITDESEFVRAVLAGQPEPPRYFGEMKRINRSGPRLLGQRPRPPRLPAEALVTAVASGMLVLDTRDAAAFGRRSYRGTLNIPANRSFSNWAGSLLPYDRELRLIADERRVDELIADLAGIGLDRVEGYWSTESVEAIPESDAMLQSVPPISLAEMVNGGPPATILDVRREGEWQAGHIPGSLNIPLGQLEERLGDVPRGRLVVHCQTGGRAAIAASLLLARGFDAVHLFPGGLAEWQAAGQPIDRAP
jgi:hydroxyacylglutathione hydrolase